MAEDADRAFYTKVQKGIQFEFHLLQLKTNHPRVWVLQETVLHPQLKQQLMRPKIFPIF